MFLLCWVLLPLATVAGWTIRPATQPECKAAQGILLRQAMNPLFVQQENLWVAVDDNDESLLGFGQIRSLTSSTNGGEWSELASLYVDPAHRRQGIASALIQHLLQGRKEKIWLLTLRPTISLYEPFGFELVPDPPNAGLPSTIQFEWKAGQIVSKFLQNDLVCMVRVSEEDTI